MSSYDQHTPPVSVRVPRAVVARIDAMVARCNRVEHGRSTRARMLRELVTRGLRDLEKRGL